MFNVGDSTFNVDELTFNVGELTLAPDNPTAKLRQVGTFPVPSFNVPRTISLTATNTKSRRTLKIML